MNYGVGRRCSSDPELLQLWLWLAAVAPIGLLAWEPLYAMGEALNDKKTKKQTNKQTNKQKNKKTKKKQRS